VVAPAAVAAADTAAPEAEPAQLLARVQAVRRTDTLFSMAALRGHNGDRPS